jgi:holo-[acyl-carrier-protein] synthase
MARLVLRTGLDLLEISRLEQLDLKIRARFLQRVFTPDELREANGSDSTLSGYFCVKEAVSKALGCGIGEIRWQDVETVSDALGAPSIQLHGRAAELAHELGLTAWAVSITHTRQVAAASVTAMGIDDR